MKKLVINADDLGYRENINKGIIYAHQNGVVTSASLLVDKEGTEDAIRLIRENPSLGLGLHLDLDGYFEIDHQKGSIVKWNEPRPDKAGVREEVKRQLDKFTSFGLTADHIDSHHHAHFMEDIFPVVCDVAKEYKIRVVRFIPQFINDKEEYCRFKKVITDNALTAIDHFIEGWYWGNIDESYNIAELMTHPGYGELWREAELAHCCQPQLKSYFVEQQIDLLRFSDIAG